MIWLSLVAFVVAALVAGLIVRWMSGHASVYGNGMPQRFHLGDVPRVGGAAVLLGMCCSWVLGVAQSQWWGDSGSLRLGGWVGLWLLVVLPAGHPLQPELVGYQRMSVLLCLNGEAMSLSPTVDYLII